MNNKTYIGVHKTDNMNDGYIGCGVYSQAHAEAAGKHGIKSILHTAIRKYNYDNFVCQPLDFFDTWEEALEEEEFLVNRDWVESNTNYNICSGGYGGSKVCTTQKQEKEIFEKFMSGEKKEDIAKEYDISVSVIYRITKDRDTTDRIIPLQSHIEERNKWLEENKQEYIQRYINGETQESLNKEAPHDLIRAEIFKNIFQKPKFLCILPNGKQFAFTDYKALKNYTGITFYRSGVNYSAKNNKLYKKHKFIKLR